MKIRFISLIIVLVLGFVPHVHAAQVPSINLVPQEQSNTEPAEISDLTRLEANWWRFFAVKGEQLEERIHNTIQRLESLPAELPLEVNDTARSLIARIRNNLLALPAARAQSVPSAPPSIAYQESYTIQQLLDILRHRREIEARLESTRYDLAAAEGTIASTRQRIDTLMAAYLAFKPTSPGRIVRALEMMAERSEMALAEEKVRVQKAVSSVYETRLRQLAEEQDVAAKRLHAELSDYYRLNREMGQANSLLAQKQKQLDTAQAAAARVRAENIVAGDLTEQAAALYHQQRVLHATVAEAIARARLAKLEIQRFLVLLLVNVPNVEPQAPQAQIQDWNAQLSAIRDRIRAWTRDSERERDLAGEAMARASQDSHAAVLSQQRLTLAQQTLVALRQLEEDFALTELLVRQAEAHLARSEGWLRTWSFSTAHALQELRNSIANWVNLSLFKIGDTPVTALGLFRVVIIIFIAWMISYWVRRVFRRLGKKREGISQSALYTVRRLSHYVIMTIGVFIGLASIGVDFTNLALVAGAIGIGVGFGLQSIVANFVSGLILLFERTLKVGDFVELASGVAGEVRAINVRSTIINTNDNVDIVVPNSQFVTGDVINWTLEEDYRRVHIPFKVSYESDKDLVKKAALEAATRLEHTLKTRSPSVWLVDFADNALELELVVWITPAAVKRPGAVNAAYKWEIETALQRYGIKIPVPQRDLRLHEDVNELFKLLVNGLHQDNISKERC